jgi:hypothetical protein
MLDADLRKRAIPWTRLLWREGAAARTLNAGWRGQICVVATGLMWLLLVFGVLAWGASGTLAFVMGLMAGFVPHLLHLRFLRLLWRSGGLALFATGVVLLPLFWSVAGLGFLVGSFRRDPHAGVAAPDQ